MVVKGKLSAGNIRVPITRPSSLDEVRLLASLWTTAKDDGIRRESRATYTIICLPLPAWQFNEVK